MPLVIALEVKVKGVQRFCTLSCLVFTKKYCPYSARILIDLIEGAFMEDDEDEAAPSLFPALPHNNEGWTLNVVNAHRILCDAFTHARTILRQEDSDPLRFRIVSENLVNNMVPILEGMETDGVAREFIEECTHVLGPLVYELEVAALALEGV